MTKAGNKFLERRKYIRLETPIKMTYEMPDKSKIYHTITKNISADGVRFDTHNKSLKESDDLELKMDIPAAANPVHAKGKIIWKRKLSLEDAAPFDIGITFTEIEEDNKNTFLKFLCDLIYNLPEEKKYANKKA